ncbi:MAG: hypothetical protein KC502_12385 [Myxococcales bacterium]|nr:hypothetical protein [Myxococcales bacterium]
MKRSTPCSTVSSRGKCAGERRCEAAGEPPTACSAPAAVTEICGDGVDQDCDGATDEGC